jgi:hypothetical protein
VASYDHELLSVAARLLRRRAGQRGKLSSAQVRRGVSTIFSAMFHFLVDEAARSLVGRTHDQRRRRRTVTRLFSHAGLKAALGKVSGASADASVVDLLRRRGLNTGPVAPPAFVRGVAKVFAEARAARIDADYDLNVDVGEADAHVLLARVGQAIAAWRAADSPPDRDFKQALGLLMLLNGKLRRDT